VGACATGVDDALGDALVVEVGDLLAKDEVFKQAGAALIGLERVLVVRDRDALLGRHRRVAAPGLLLQLAGIPA
jgi:hypothetical protein